jgi:hypothetical protein
MTTDSKQITNLLLQISSGDASAANELFPVVYAELQIWN